MGMGFASGPHMAPAIARRVELLEEKLDSLAQLPIRVASLETAFGELRADVRGLSNEVGALRNEVGALRDEVGILRGEVSTLRGELNTLRDDLRREIREGDDETRRQMRVLHEDLIARFALLQEGINGRNARQRRAKRKKR